MLNPRSGRRSSGAGSADIDEVRISRIARSATDMAFDTNAPPIPPSISPQPVDQFLGVGETLVIQSHASSSPPLSYQWQKSSGETWNDIADQTADLLSLPVTFETAGDYRYLVSNAYGSATSDVAQVTIGALFSGLFRTGFDDAWVQLVDGAVDPHYTLTEPFPNAVPGVVQTEGAESVLNVAPTNSARYYRLAYP